MMTSPQYVRGTQGFEEYWKLKKQGPETNADTGMSTYTTPLLLCLHRVGQLHHQTPQQKLYRSFLSPTSPHIHLSSSVWRLCVPRDSGPLRLKHATVPSYTTPTTVTVEPVLQIFTYCITGREKKTPSKAYICRWTQESIKIKHKHPAWA